MSDSMNKNWPQKPSESGFKTPPNYFEQMEGRALKQIHSTEKSARVISIKSILLTSSAIAACIIGVLVWTGIPANSTESEKSSDLMAEINATELESFLQENLNEEELLDLSNAFNLENALASSENQFSDLSNTSITQLLMDEAEYDEIENFYE